MPGVHAHSLVCILTAWPPFREGGAALLAMSFGRLTTHPGSERRDKGRKRGERRSKQERQQEVERGEREKTLVLQSSDTMSSGPWPAGK